MAKNLIIPPTKRLQVRESPKPQPKIKAAKAKEQSPELYCPHRGGLLGQLDCACGGKPAVLACTIHGRCLRRAPGKPWPLKFVPLVGQPEELSRENAPTVCAMCADGPNAAKVAEFRRGVDDARVGLTWPASERWDPGQLRFIRCADLAEHALRIIPQLPPNASGIVGIPRSGMLPAGILATSLHLPLYYLDPTRGPVRIPGVGRDGKLADLNGPLVVIDDTSWMGGSIRRARALLGKRPAIYGAVYVRDPRNVDVYAVHVPGSQILEWNIFNNTPLAASRDFRELTGGAACDFDGVLCEEPIVSDRQDLPRFLQWLSNARPRYVPRYVPIPLVISFRLEAWRGVTQTWSAHWGIRVQSLVLHPAATVQERDAHLDVAGHKGETFRRSRCSLMFESDPRQCAVIHDTSRKHVICPSTGQVWQGVDSAAVSVSARSLVPHNSVSLSKLAVVTCLFSRVASRNRAANFREFAAGLQAGGIDLWGIEGLYAGQTPLSVASEWWQHVPLQHTLWHKERLLNLLVDGLPSDYDAVAWVDADLLFSDPAGLPVRVLAALRQYPIAQLWETAEQLGPDDRPVPWWNGQQIIQSMAAYNAGRQLADTNASHSHAGFAWSMRRDVWRQLGGLYEIEINGGADATMASAFWGDIHSDRFAQLNRHMQSAIAAWSGRAFGIVAGRVGCVPGTIRHLYHGTIPNRQYWERLVSVSRLGYNPATHLTVEPGKPLRWSAAAPQELRDFLGHYLTQTRAEDDHLRAGA